MIELGLPLGAGLLVGCAMVMALEFLRSLLAREVCVCSGILGGLLGLVLWVSHPDIPTQLWANPPAFLAGALPIVGLWLASRWVARETPTATTPKAEADSGPMPAAQPATQH